jgi:hypothetical protein
MLISAPFAAILAAGRAQFNARVAETRRRVPGFDGAAFAEFLRGGVDGLVAEVARRAPERVAPVALAAYDIALDLVAQGLAGPQARHDLINRAWAELTPRLALRVAEAPAETLGALSNAAVYLAKTPGLRGDEWLGQMAALAGQVQSVPQLLALGQLLAWRAGAAHFRLGALAAAEALPPSLALAAVGAAADADWAQVRQGFLANPWWWPQRAKARGLAGREVGAFSGFGGTFSQPPRVRAAAEGFWVHGGDRYNLLMADAWGATLHPASAEEFAQPEPALVAPGPSLDGSRLSFFYGTVELDLPAAGLALVCNAHTAAVTSPYSHAIHLFPLA